MIKGELFARVVVVAALGEVVEVEAAGVETEAIGAAELSLVNWFVEV